MATKAVPSSAQLERKLRPLYDAIDNGQHKKAITLADKLLKKQSDLLSVKALKAIALLRTGKQDEGMKLIEMVVEACPTEQSTLQFVTSFFREIGEYRRIVEVYTAAAQHNGRDGEILTHLFMAHVRVGDYQKQQQVAASLNKVFPLNRPYYCWRVMSVLLQANDSSDERLVNSMYLPLADRLIEKFVNEKRIDGEAEMQLYLLVLDKLGKTEQKLDVIRGDIGNNFRSADQRVNEELGCLLKLERWEEAVAMLTAMLRELPDQWSFVKDYISCLIRLYQRTRKKTCGGEGEGEEGRGEEKGVGEEEGDGSSLKPLVIARDFLEELTAREKGKLDCSTEKREYVVRGPFLGRIVVALELMKMGMADRVKLAAPPLALLLDYFHVFGNKSCCYDDLHTFLAAFPCEVSSKFLSEVQLLVDQNPVDYSCQDCDLKKNINFLHWHKVLLQFKRFLGCHDNLSKEELTALLAECRYRYRMGLRLGSKLLDTVNQYSDFYVILATHIKIDLYNLTGDVALLWEAAVMLEEAKQSNPQILLLLMKIYGFLGVAEFIPDLFDELAIKHVQIETLGYIPLGYLQATGPFLFANHIYRVALRFYYGSSKEIGEYMIQAYKNGTFAKIIEFVELQKRLEHSLGFTCILVNMNQLEMVTSIHSVSEANKFFEKEWFSGLPYTCPNLEEYCSKLVDGRDMKVFDDWTSRERPNAKASFDIECLWLRVRVVLIQSIREALFLTTAEGRQVCRESESGCTRLDKKIAELLSTIGSFSEHSDTAPHQLTLHSPPPCSGLVFLKEAHGNLLLDMLAVIKSVAMGATSVRPTLERILGSLQACASALEGLPVDVGVFINAVAADKQQTAKSIGVSHPYFTLMRTTIDLQRYVALLEAVSLLVLLCGVCAEILNPSGTTPVPASSTSKKKKKKKKNPHSAPPVFLKTPLSDEVVNFTKELRELLSAVLKKFQPLPDVEDELAERLLELYIAEEERRSKPNGSTPDGVGVGEAEEDLVAEMATVTLSSCEDASDTSASRLESAPATVIKELSSEGQDLKTDCKQELSADVGKNHVLSESQADSAGDEVVGDTAKDSVGGEDVSSNVRKSASLVHYVCKGSLESYNTSFRECRKVIQAKIEFIDAIISQLEPDAADDSVA